jgi:hypothetical protein
MKDYSVTIKPLTPIWTGDAQRKGDTLRETGIIGSLRWWYEALIRGLGGSACDPTKQIVMGKIIVQPVNSSVVPDGQGSLGWKLKK